MQVETSSAEFTFQERRAYLQLVHTQQLNELAQFVQSLIRSNRQREDVNPLLYTVTKPLAKRKEQAFQALTFLHKKYHDDPQSTVELIINQLHLSKELYKHAKLIFKDGFILLCFHESYARKYASHLDHLLGQQESKRIPAGFYSSEVFIEFEVGGRIPVLVVDHLEEEEDFIDLLNHEIAHLVGRWLKSGQKLEFKRQYLNDIEIAPFIFSKLEVLFKEKGFECVYDLVETELGVAQEEIVDTYVEEMRADSTSKEFCFETIQAISEYYQDIEYSYVCEFKETIEGVLSFLKTNSSLSFQQKASIIKLITRAKLEYKQRIILITQWLQETWKSSSNKAEFTHRLLVIPNNKPWFLAEFCGHDRHEMRKIFYQVSLNSEEINEQSLEMMFQCLAEYSVFRNNGDEEYDRLKEKVQEKVQLSQLEYESFYIEQGNLEKIVEIVWYTHAKRVEAFFQSIEKYCFLFESEGIKRSIIVQRFEKMKRRILNEVDHICYWIVNQLFFVQRPGVFREIPVKNRIKVLNSVRVALMAKKN